MKQKKLYKTPFSFWLAERERLRPLTKKIPKPLVKLDHKNSILGLLLQNLKNQGFKRFHISVNYLSKILKNILKKITKLLI